MHKNSCYRLKQKRSRSGAVVLELILTAPAFLMIALAVVQISLVYTAIEQTAFASRYAAKIASETTSGGLTALNTGPNGPLKTGVDRILQVGGLPQGSCRVILEHNVDSFTEQTIADPDPAAANCNCDPPSTSLPVVTGVTTSESVRTTVCVRLGDNIPDFLSTFGFPTADYIVEESTTYIYEL